MLLGQSSHNRRFLHRWLDFTFRRFSLHRGFALHFCSYIIFKTAVLQIGIALKFVEISLPLQSLDFVQVFQSTCYMTQYLLSSVCSYAFVHRCWLNDGFQHVIRIINLEQFMDFISSSYIGSTRSREFWHFRKIEKLFSNCLAQMGHI